MTNNSETVDLYWPNGKIALTLPIIYKRGVWVVGMEGDSLYVIVHKPTGVPAFLDDIYNSDDAINECRKIASMYGMNYCSDLVPGDVPVFNHINLIRTGSL